MFESKIIWITGASSGIGEAVAFELARLRCKLVLSARRKAELERVRSKCLERGAAEVLVLPLDITDEAAMPAAVEEAVSFGSRIDILFNNAGISQRSYCVDTNMETYRKLFEVDVFGQIALTKQVLPLMLKQGSGHITVTSSVAGKVGVKQRTGYCAAKHAVIGFFDALRAEVESQGVFVTTITPGFIRTAISENALKGDGSAFGEVDDDIGAGMNAATCAKVIVKELGKRRREIAVGDGKEMKALWLKRFLPNLLFKLMAKMP